MVGVLSDDERKYSYQAAAAVRQAGVNAEVFPGAPKMKKQLQYANRKAIEYVILVGQSEAERGEVILKNMKTGDQENLSLDALIERLSD